MLRPLKDALIAEIDITQMCHFRCSNCTRATAHVRKPFIMDFQTYKKAVDSLLEFKGATGLIGGEPTMHPEFAKFATYLREAQGAKPLNNGLEPMTDILAYRNKHLSKAEGKKRVLFTSLGKKFYEHSAVIWETFDMIGMNDHTHCGEHQAMLIASEELPLSEKEWKERQSNCWLFNQWSPTITPHGCYACEIHGTLDALFNGGKLAKPIEPNWWKRDLDYFKDQFALCRKCGIAFNTPSRVANEGIQDVSPKMLEALKAIDSPAIRHGRYRVFDIANYRKEGNAFRPTEMYLPKQNNAVRMAATNKSVFPKRLEGLTVSVGMADYLALTLPWNVKHFDRFVVVTSSDDKESQAVAQKHGATLVISDRHKENGARFNKGKLINEGMKALEYDDWMLFVDVDVLLPSNLRREFDRHVWNPDVLYYATRLHTPQQGQADWVRRYQKKEALAKTLKFSDPPTNRMPWGYFQLFNCRARALAGRGQKVVSEDFVSAGGIDKHFLELWKPARRVLSPFTIIHIYHGSMGMNWTGRKSATLSVGFTPTVPVVSDEWLNVAWLDEHGYNETYPTPGGGFLKVIRVDTGECVIVPNTPAPGGSNALIGPKEYCALHAGVIARGQQVSVHPKNRGRVIVHRSGGKEFSGWGMGHVMYQDDRQGYCWAGQAIGPTRFDVFWKQTINQEESAHLVR
ncbi:MAG: hypothetical protein ABFE07_28615 [Armatimonadia bacterium]